MATKYDTDVVNSMLSAVSSVIPVQMQREVPTIVDAPVANVEMGVLVGVTGQVRGRLLAVGAASVFGGIAEAMFGMRIEGEMLESFVGELGNMLAGTMSTNVSLQGINIDITPPTVIVGDTKLTGFQHALSVPVKLENIGELHILMIFEES